MILKFLLFLFIFGCSKSDCIKINNSKSYTFTMIKPHVASDIKKVNKIKQIINQNGFKIIDEKKIVLNEVLFNDLYSIHSNKSFFKDLKKDFVNKQIYVLKLEHETSDAVIKYRELIGNTDPKKAKKDTIRNLFGLNVQDNAVHASDSNQNANREINIFFK